MDRRRYLRHWNSGIRIPDRTFVASYVCDLWCDAGIRTGTHLYRNYLDCSEMVPGKNGIRIRCGRNGKRTVWILSGTNQQKNPAGRGTGKDIPDHWCSRLQSSWILCGIFFTAPDKEWRRKAERALREQNVANRKCRSTDRTKAVHIRRDDEDKELLSSSGDDAVWADFLFPGVTGITDISD